MIKPATKPTRGDQFWWPDAYEAVWLERVLDDGNYLVCNKERREDYDDYYSVNPKDLRPAKKAHYSIPKKKKKPTPAQTAQSIADKARAAGLSVWFGDQILAAPNYCENCGKPLNPGQYNNPRTIICHILPKSKKGGFNNLETHPLNRWFGCGDCHTNYDHKGQEYQAKMPVAPLIIERFLQFKDLIIDRDIIKLPDWLYSVYNGK